MEKFLKIGPIFIIIAATLWSFDGVLRQSLYSLPPAVVVFWEHILGLIILFPFVLAKSSDLKKMTKREWGAIGLVALFSGALGTILYTAALGMINYIQLSVVVLLQQLQPIWAITTAAILLKERISKKFAIWAAIAIIGAYFVTFKDLHINLQTGSGTIIAALFALLAGVMWGSSTSFSKIVLHRVSFLSASFLRFLLAPVFAFIIVILFHQTGSITHIDAVQWKTLLIITFTTGMVGLVIYYFGLRTTPAKVSAICELVWPCSAILIDYFYFHKTLSITQMIGVVVVLFAIYKVSSLKNERT